MTGAELRDAGLDQATSGSSAVLQVLWGEHAAYAILQLALADSSFSAEDLRKAAGEPPTVNAIGAAFRTAYRKGWIRPDGYTLASRPSRHASILRLWRRA